ncbi:MAG: cyclic pyranopterin monophosphate synthase MoaC, partial [Euryarchaeota archaeon]|nr:cyclic pyranopterin monophosphate synthase MoaC [Euryarchaeota archaeon]
MIEGIIDVSQKPKVMRTAKATGILHLQQTTVEKIQSTNVKKGDVLEASTIAAIQA